MKRLIILFTALVLGITLNAQKNSSLGAGAGISTPGYGFTVNYNLISTNLSNIRFKLTVLQSKNKTEYYTCPYNTIALDAGFYYNVFKNRTRSIVINLGGSGSLAYELINMGRGELETGEILETTSGLMYGLSIGGETEIFIAEKFSFFFNIDQYYYFNSNITSFLTFAGGGLKFYF